MELLSEEVGELSSGRQVVDGTEEHKNGRYLCLARESNFVVQISPWTMKERATPATEVVLPSWLRCDADVSTTLVTAIERNVGVTSSGSAGARRGTLEQVVQCQTMCVTGKS